MSDNLILAPFPTARGPHVNKATLSKLSGLSPLEIKRLMKSGLPHEGRIRPTFRLLEATAWIATYHALERGGPAAALLVRAAAEKSFAEQEVERLQEELAKAKACE